MPVLAAHPHRQLKFFKDHTNAIKTKIPSGAVAPERVVVFSVGKKLLSSTPVRSVGKAITISKYAVHVRNSIIHQRLCQILFSSINYRPDRSDLKPSVTAAKISSAVVTSLSPVGTGC